MNDDLPSEPMKYAINQWFVAGCLSVALALTIEAVVMMAVKFYIERHL